MSPDIEWHIRDSAEQKTIIKATLPRRSRRSWIAIMIVILIGIGLGVVYRSIPEPAPRPTPLPSATPRPTLTYPVIPAKLYTTIDREAQALADGDVQAYLALHVYEDPVWTQQFTSTFQAWERPTDGQPLYSVIDFNQSIATTAWVDIRQFRNGRSFRETRFYVWQKDRWLRNELDPFFWSSRTETRGTPHFHVIYFVEDRDFIQPVMNQLEQAQDQLCIDLGCDTTVLTYTLRFTSYSIRSFPGSVHGHEIYFASPRVMGVYEDNSPLGDQGVNMISPLAWTTALQRAYGQPAATDDRPSDLLLYAISQWATMRTANWPDTENLSAAKAALQKQPMSWDDLWNVTENNYEAVHPMVYAVVRFIDQEYGAPAIARILKDIRIAKSFKDLIENGLSVPFEEFDQKWQAWLKQ